MKKLSISMACIFVLGILFGTVSCKKDLTQEELIAGLDETSKESIYEDVLSGQNSDQLLLKLSSEQKLSLLDKLLTDEIKDMVYIEKLTESEKIKVFENILSDKRFNDTFLKLLTDDEKTSVYAEKLTESEKIRIFDEIIEGKRTDGIIIEILNAEEKEIIFDILLSEKTNVEFIKEILNREENEELRDSIKDYLVSELTKEELQAILDAKDTVAPSDVTNLKVDARSGTVYLSWIDCSDEDVLAYEVTWAENTRLQNRSISFLPGSVVATPSTKKDKTNMAVVANLNSETEYTFTVRSIDTTGNKSDGVTIISFGDKYAGCRKLDLSISYEDTLLMDQELVRPHHINLTVYNENNDFEENKNSLKTIHKDGLFFIETEFLLREGDYSVKAQVIDDINGLILAETEYNSILIGEEEKYTISFPVSIFIGSIQISVNNPSESIFENIEYEFSIKRVSDSDYTSLTTLNPCLATGAYTVLSTIKENGKSIFKTEKNVLVKESQTNFVCFDFSADEIESAYRKEMGVLVFDGRKYTEYNNLQIISGDYFFVDQAWNSYPFSAVTHNGYYGDQYVNINTFYIGKYELTYETWNVVKQWAECNGYTFDGTYYNGFNSFCSNLPVCGTSWRDAIVWCNAFSEMMGFTPVYYSDSNYLYPIRETSNSNDVDYLIYGSVDCPYIYASFEGNIEPEYCSSNGYRLPTDLEWEYAARGGNPNGFYWSKLFSGGDNLDYYGWYSYNSSYTVKSVGMKRANTVGLYDMCGNIQEWIFGSEISRWGKMPSRGGSVFSDEESCSLEYTAFWYDQNSSNLQFGFRIARNYVED